MHTLTVSEMRSVTRYDDFLGSKFFNAVSIHVIRKIVLSLNKRK